MKKNALYKRSATTIFVISLLVLFLSKCIDKSKEQDGLLKNATGKQFAGSATCANCHKEIYTNYIHTAHALTSQPASEQSIKGSFAPSENSFSYGNNTIVAMEKRSTGFYQVEYDNGIEKAAHRFDIVVGSGVKGQSFITIHNNQFFQLPITYFSAAKEWSNSPGYPNKIIFNRPITSRCLECHTTFAKTLPTDYNTPEKFDNTKIIYSISCEKCHGPGAEHVAFQTQNPNIKTAKYIINPATLTRQQNLEFCASCHGGRLKKTKPSFEFAIGDTLANYFESDTTVPNPNNIDVHGNQYGLLKASKCFKMSTTMTCNTCHNAHDNERGNTVVFSQRCLNCHQNQNSATHQTECKLIASYGAIIKRDCISCHMPLKSSKAIAVFLPGNTAPTAARIRSHLITVYPEETQKVLLLLTKSVK
ncbi:multiheme c-type cytochrome [Parasediminibacterium paludis]|uniref:Multiheme c-type cytochrome n=1 Tax=Parasediminibacterium paludis TaxID=908966 RepID=A0ABV8PUZ1_9BACT